MTVDFKWYILGTVSGMELNVKRDIEEQIALKGMDGYISEIRVLEVDKKQVNKKGNVTVRSKSLLLGYIMIKMCMLPEVRDLILSIHKVGSFLGTKKNPAPLTEEEIDDFCTRVMSQYDSATNPSSSKIAVGDKVKIIDGPFVEFLGSVSCVDDASSKLKVSVSIFGKLTEIELNFDQVSVCN